MAGEPVPARVSARPELKRERKRRGPCGAEAPAWALPRTAYESRASRKCRRAACAGDRSCAASQRTRVQAAGKTCRCSARMGWSRDMACREKGRSERNCAGWRHRYGKSRRHVVHPPFLDRSLPIPPSTLHAPHNFRPQARRRHVRVHETLQPRENPPPFLLHCTVLGMSRDATMPRPTAVCQLPQEAAQAAPKETCCR